MNYRPSRVVPEQWYAVRPFVIDCIVDYQPASIKTARELTSHLTHYVLWGVFRMHAPLQRADLLYPTMIRRYVNATRRTVSAQQSAESRLFQIAHALTGQERTLRSRYTVGDVAEYGLRELAELDAWAATRRSDTARRDAHTLIGLLAGAGVRTWEVEDIRRNNIATEPDGRVRVSISGSRARVVSVSDDFARYFAGAISIPNDNRRALFRGRSTPESVRSAMRQLTNGPHPAPDLTRLRDTFVLRVLRTTPVAEAMTVCGLANTVSLNRYLPYLSPSNS